jgi:hypothetical protein
MLQALQTKSIDLLDSVVKTIESYDDFQKRESYFAEKCIHQHKEGEGDTKPSSEDEDSISKAEEGEGKEQSMPLGEKFKHLSYELIDIGLHGGQKGINYLKETQVYKQTDKYIKYEEKYEVAKEKGVKLYRFLNEKVYHPLKDNIFIVYDEATNYISFMIKAFSETWLEQQTKIIHYVRDKYENVQFFVSENWLRLDFDNDGHVSKEDLQKAFAELYDFLIHFEYYQKAVEIKSKLYEEAIKFMQKDLHNEEKKESKQEEGDSKIQQISKEEEEDE